MVQAANMQPDAAGHRATGGQSSPGWWRPLIVTTVGGCLTGFILAVGLSPSAPSVTMLATVAHADIADASLSMNRTAGQQAIDEAKRCQVPLAFVTLSVAPGNEPAEIIIRSGSYASSPIGVSLTPIRVALPFPSPYPSGRGVLLIEGRAKALSIWLTPAWSRASLDGSEQINVVWTPKKPC